MTSEQLAAAWSAPSNGLHASEAKSLTAAFLNEVKARKRRSSLGLATVAIAFAAISALSVAVVLSQKDLGAEHAGMFAAMNVLIWGGWIVALVSHLGRDRPPKTAGAPVRQALQQALLQRQAHLSHLRIIASGMLLSTPLVAIAIKQMVETGRLAQQNVPYQIAFALAAYGVAFICLGIDYFGRTGKEIDGLESLVSDCERTARPEPADQA